MMTGASANGMTGDHSSNGRLDADYWCFMDDRWPDQAATGGHHGAEVALVVQGRRLRPAVAPRVVPEAVIRGNTGQRTYQRSQQ